MEWMIIIMIGADTRAECAAGDGLDVALFDLDEPTVAQRSFRRERIPGRLVKERQREGKAGIGVGGVSLGAGAQAGDAGIEFHGGAQQHKSCSNRESLKRWLDQFGREHRCCVAELGVICLAIRRGRWLGVRGQPCQP
jgi:hypothetical protein